MNTLVSAALSFFIVIVDTIWLLVGRILSEDKWPMSFFKRVKRNPNIPPPPFSRMVAAYNFPIRLEPRKRNEVSIIEED
jgi:hypothetical protein